MGDKALISLRKMFAWIDQHDFVYLLLLAGVVSVIIMAIIYAASSAGYVSERQLLQEIIDKLDRLIEALEAKP